MRIDFRGYAGDCTLTGQIELEGERLSDALNRSDQLVVHDAVLCALANGRELAVGLVVLGREDLFAVEAEAPAGDDRRRVRTVRHAMRAHAGPYVIFGEIHALPGVAPQRIFAERRAMTPLTNCVIVFERNGAKQTRRAPLVLVNGQLLEAIDLATAEELDDELAALAAT